MKKEIYQLCLCLQLHSVPTLDLSVQAQCGNKAQSFPKATHEQSTEIWLFVAFSLFWWTSMAAVQHPLTTPTSYFCSFLQGSCASQNAPFFEANYPESWMLSSCADLILNPQKGKNFKKYSECTANSNYPDVFPISAMGCSCICFWAGNSFHLSHGERRTQIPGFHCLEESPQHTHLGVNWVLCWKGAWPYSCCSRTQLARTIYIAWKPGNRACIQLILLNCYFLKSPSLSNPQEVSPTPLIS